MTRIFCMVAVAGLAACGSSSDDAVADGGAADAASFADAGCRGVGDGAPVMSLEVTAQVKQFETGAAPAESVEVAIHPAWIVAHAPFQLACSPVGEMEAGAAGDFVVAFPATTAPAAFVGAMVVTGPTEALSINDKRLPVPCGNGVCTIGSAAAPYPVWVLSQTTFDTWNLTIRADLATTGFVVLTFRDASGQPASGVVPYGRKGDGSYGALAPASEVYFVAADRRAIEARTSTGASGTVIIPMAAGTEMTVQGMKTGIEFETGLNVATVPGGVFFEQSDPR